MGASSHTSTRRMVRNDHIDGRLQAAILQTHFDLPAGTGLVDRGQQVAVSVTHQRIAPSQHGQRADERQTVLGHLQPGGSALPAATSGMRQALLGLRQTESGGSR